jgi:rhodanese-related sulfurtransferase
MVAIGAFGRVETACAWLGLAALVACSGAGGGADPAPEAGDAAAEETVAIDVAALDVPPEVSPDVSPDVAPDAIGDEAAATPDPGPAVLTPVAPADLKAEFDAKDFLLINVHVPYEGEIPGTDEHIKYTETEALVAFIGGDLDAQVVLYCMSNGMSTYAGNSLVTAGYRAVRYLDGGMAAWKQAGYPFTEP